MIVGSLTTTTDHGFWVAGAGIENAFAANWSWKVEYLYLDTGNISDTFIVGGVAVATSSKFTDHIIRAGVNYRF